MGRAGAIGCLLATLLQTLIALAAGEPFGIGGLAILPMFALFYMVLAVPASAVIGTLLTFAAERCRIEGMTRVAAFSAVGCIAAPAIWAFLVADSGYFSFDLKVTLIIGLSCGFMCGLAAVSLTLAAAD